MRAQELLAFAALGVGNLLIIIPAKEEEEEEEEETEASLPSPSSSSSVPKKEEATQGYLTQGGGGKMDCQKGGARREGGFFLLRPDRRRGLNSRACKGFANFCRKKLSVSIFEELNREFDGMCKNVATLDSANLRFRVHPRRFLRIFQLFERAKRGK